MTPQKILLAIKRINDSVVFIDHVEVGELLRSKGLGDLILKAFCSWCDDQKIDVHCEPFPFNLEEPEFTTHQQLLDWRKDNKDRLVQWYTRNGFVNKNGVFVRQYEKCIS